MSLKVEPVNQRQGNYELLVTTQSSIETNSLSSNRRSFFCTSRSSFYLSLFATLSSPLSILIHHNWPELASNVNPIKCRVIREGAISSKYSNPFDRRVLSRNSPSLVLDTVNSKPMTCKERVFYFYDPNRTKDTERLLQLLLALDSHRVLSMLYSATLPSQSLSPSRRGRCSNNRAHKQQPAEAEWASGGRIFLVWQQMRRVREEEHEKLTWWRKTNVLGVVVNVII